MAGEHLFVFCYDISFDRSRRKVAEALERHATRVQESVFEMHGSAEKAQAVLGSLAKYRGHGDSIRMYCLTKTGRQLSACDGGAPIAEETEFWLL